MNELELKTFVIGNLSSNCYLVFNKELKEGFLVDCPGSCEELDDFIQTQELKILFIALTHAHFDHIGGLNKYSLPFYVHQNDAAFLKDPRLNGSLFFDSSVIVEKEPCFYQEGVPLDFGKYSLEIIHTPGHTPGSVSLKLNKRLFSGDAIFSGSIGRTDIPLASQDLLIQSIKEKILTLSSDTLIYPGHGPATTVEQERKHNPFL